MKTEKTFNLSKTCLICLSFALLIKKQCRLRLCTLRLKRFDDEDLTLEGYQV